MADAVERLMEADEFLEWCAAQEGRYELVEGEIIAMAGATSRHDEIVVNILSALRARLKGGPCRPYSGDFAVRTKRRTIRRPDVTVDCGERRSNALQADRPTAVFEVLSPSTRQTDLVKKLDEYRALAGLRHVVLIEPSVAAGLAFSRNADGSPWSEKDIDGLEEAIGLEALGISLPMAEVYADVELDPE